MKRFLVIAGLLGIITAAWASAPRDLDAVGQDSLRAAVDSAFARGQYERVELLTLRAGTALDARPVDTRVAVNLTVGYALIMLGRETEAETYFRRALDADPATRLDPVRISPKFRRVFDEVKAAYRPPMKKPPDPSVAQWSGPRPQAVLSNLLVPGSGQFLEGRRGRGILWTGTELALAGVFIWRLEESRQSRDTYVNEMDRARVHSAYTQYTSDYQMAWAAGVAVGVVYLASQVDLALLRRKIEHVEISTLDTDHGCGLGLTVRW